ncbi:aminodeoxychorismate/anthranilate synthase component II [Bradyrhizobium sp. LMTR 3]|uniref:glutamine amidotransferase-related protein n=1 Tax=Bradyrhizobium sp. LMTR 3 TaxID=189873 RepID=UPI0024C07C74|nr:aminodeoxychorismate/anthranilate synthase component II [Bradyrhizobium sp. LMTR 3]
MVLSSGRCTLDFTVLIHEFSGQFQFWASSSNTKCIGSVFGGRVASTPMHGRSSHTTHDCQWLFKGTPPPLSVSRHHSPVVVLHDMLRHLTVTAHSDEAEIMAFTHGSQSTYGVQLHPGNDTNEHGRALLMNFLRLVETCSA